VSQGVIGIECRSDDSTTRELLAALEHGPTRLAMDAERAFSGHLGGNCQSPVAAYARLDAGKLMIDGLVAEPDGSRLLRDRIFGNPHDGSALGVELAERVLAAGAGPLLERLRAV
jgi:hydroxymethylbilane synthase